MILTTLAVATYTLAVPPQTFPEYEKQMLKVGQTIPDYEIPTHTGAKVKLLDYVKKNKATLINFWFYN